MTTLATVAAGQPVCITGFASSGVWRHRLLAMGILPGVPITVLRTAPLGDPLQLQIRGYTLSLRKHFCEQILVKPL